MDYEDRRALVENTTYTLDGEPCSVAGWRNDYAAVAPRSGGFYHATWEAIAAAAANGGRIDRDQLIFTSGAWLGVKQ